MKEISVWKEVIPNSPNSRAPSADHDLLLGGRKELLTGTPPLGEVMDKVAGGGAIADHEAWALVTDGREELDRICEAASRLRDEGKGNTVTFSPKVFIPLTHLCRDFCGYCTFRRSPEQAGDTLYMTPEQVLDVARAGERLGCTEALFTWENGRSSVILKPVNGWRTAGFGRPWNTWPMSAGWWSKRPNCCHTPTPAP